MIQTNYYVYACICNLALFFMPASLVTRLMANGTEIGTTMPVEVSHAVLVLAIPSSSIHVALKLLFLPPTLP